MKGVIYFEIFLRLLYLITLTNQLLFFDQVSSNSREGLTNSDSPMLGRKPRRSSMLLNTDFEEDDDFYDEDHDEFDEPLEKQNEGID